MLPQKNHGYFCLLPIWLDIKSIYDVFSETTSRRQTFVFSATLTFVPTKPQRLRFAKKKKKKDFHQITTKEKLGKCFCYTVVLVKHYRVIMSASYFIISVKLHYTDVRTNRHNMLCVFVRSSISGEISNLFMFTWVINWLKVADEADEQIFILACSCVILSSVLFSHAVQVYFREPKINAISYLAALFIPNALHILRRASSLASFVTFNSAFHNSGSFLYTFMKFLFDNLSMSMFNVCINCVTDHVVKRIVSIARPYRMLYNLSISNSTTRTPPTDERTNTQHVATSQHLDMSGRWDVAKCSSVGGELLYSKLATCCVCLFVRSSVCGVVCVRPCSGFWHLVEQETKLSLSEVCARFARVSYVLSFMLRCRQCCSILSAGVITNEACCYYESFSQSVNRLIRQR